MPDNGTTLAYLVIVCFPHALAGDWHAVKVGSTFSNAWRDVLELRLRTYQCKPCVTRATSFWRKRPPVLALLRLRSCSRLHAEISEVVCNSATALRDKASPDKQRGEEI